MIQDAAKVRNACFGFLAAAVLLALISLLVQQKTVKFRLENTYSNVYWLKWLFWLVEISFVPLLFNISWYGNCKFTTDRQALTLADCKNDFEGNHNKIILTACVPIAFGLAATYIGVLWWIINDQKVSAEFHEYQVTKKEVEMVLNINKLWSTNKIYTFSSFRNGVMAMNHRVVFNTFIAWLVLVEVWFVSVSSLTSVVKQLFARIEGSDSRAFVLTADHVRLRVKTIPNHMGKRYSVGGALWPLHANPAYQREGFKLSAVHLYR